MPPALTSLRVAFAKSAGNPLFARDLVLRLFEAQALEGIIAGGSGSSNGGGDTTLSVTSSGMRVIRLLGSTADDDHSHAGGGGGELGALGSLGDDDHYDHASSSTGRALVARITAALPSSIEGLVRARFDRLGATEKEVLKVRTN